MSAAVDAAGGVRGELDRRFLGKLRRTVGRAIKTIAGRFRGRPHS